MVVLKVLEEINYKEGRRRSPVLYFIRVSLALPPIGSESPHLVSVIDHFAAETSQLPATLFRRRRRRRSFFVVRRFPVRVVGVQPLVVVVVDSLSLPFPRFGPGPTL